MDYQILTYIHLSTVLPAFFIGTVLLFMRKGTPLHKLSGKLYMCLMLGTALLTLFMSARVGPQFFGHFGYIHLLSLLVIWTVPRAWFAIQRGDIKVHRNAMISLYVGGLMIAGGFAFFPGRLLHEWLFG